MNRPGATVSTVTTKKVRQGNQALVINQIAADLDRLLQKLEAAS